MERKMNLPRDRTFWLYFAYLVSIPGIEGETLLSTGPRDDVATMVMSAAVAGVLAVLILRNELKSGRAGASRYRFAADLLFIALLPIVYIALLAVPIGVRYLIYYGLGFGSIYLIRRCV